jgi:Flp pilus assembly protein TadD
MKKRACFLFAVAFLFAFAAAWRCSGPVRESQLQLGIWAAENNLWEEALFRWKKEVASRPRSAAAHNNLAVALEKKGLWDDALREYEEALKLAPGNAQIKANLQKFKDNREAPAKAADAKANDPKGKGSDENP